MYNRETDLRTAFNTAMVSLLNIEEQDYYSKLTTEQMLSLKSMLSVINNVITLRLAFSLAEWICRKLNIAGEARDKILEIIRLSKPNANGYDIEVIDPDLVAEVKCNIPVKNGRVYGAKQLEGLRTDINGLLNGKHKSSKKTAGSIKILGLYDTEKIRAATEHFIKNLPAELNQKLIIDPRQEQTIDNQHVYIVFIKPYGEPVDAANRPQSMPLADARVGHRKGGIL